ncbi:MAG: hypothetical protein ACLR5H_04210 [Oscillospiraceae bacterium]
MNLPGRVRYLRPADGPAQPRSSDDTVTLTILRDGQQFDVEVTSAPTAASAEHPTPSPRRENPAGVLFCRWGPVHMLEKKPQEGWTCVTGRRGFC